MQTVLKTKRYQNQLEDIADSIKDKKVSKSTYDKLIKLFLDAGEDLQEMLEEDNGDDGDDEDDDSWILIPSLPMGSKPDGKEETPDINDPRPINRQNETAFLMASHGFDVEMLPNKINGNGHGNNATASPDYLIEKKACECYSPTSDSPRNIWTTIKKKSEEQANNIILNLDDCPISVEAILLNIKEYPIPTLTRLIYVKNGVITQVRVDWTKNGLYNVLNVKDVEVKRIY